METDDLICDIESAIISEMDIRGLACLRGVNHDYLLNDKQILQWYFEVVKSRRLAGSEFDFNKNFDDLLICSDEIMYFLANMYLYLPFINDPIRDAFSAWDKTIYPNRQNLSAKRFNMYANIVSEKIYNYWDRIGDLIGAYFPDIIKPNQVYFHRVLTIIPDEFKDSTNFKWLDNFRKTKYAAVNQRRKQTVHYISLDTEFKYAHLGKSMSRKRTIRLMEKRREMPDLFRDQLTLTLTGFEKTLLLIEEISAKIDIPSETSI